VLPLFAQFRHALLERESLAVVRLARQLATAGDACVCRDSTEQALCESLLLGYYAAAPAARATTARRG
jgi:hypothetical protein